VVSSKSSTFDQMPPQNGKTVVITGGAGGIGLRAAQGFAQRGAQVIIGARNAARAEQAAADVKRVAPGAEVGWEPLDLAELASVHRFAETLTTRGTPIDVLVNCAGVMAIPQRELTVDGFERHFGVNHLGHFALTGLLLPLLGRNGQARVVTVSALSARSARLDPSNLQLEHGYAPMRAYGNSKIANVLFALELNAHVDPERVLSIPIHPGTANTGIQQYTASRVSRAAGQLIMRVLGQPLDRVADPIAFAATTPDATTNSFVAPTGRFELGGVPGFVSLPALALDEELRATLWEASERLTGVKY
jgi:NAD(P)-dependent dehydrogenase (short-subunit alcohol dehydrogenase family)